jgi:ribonuclease HI
MASRKEGPQRTWQIGIGPASDWTVHAAELIAIGHAVDVISHERVNRRRDKKYTIVSDSQSAIKAIANPSNKPGQAIVHRILDRVQAFRDRRIKIRLHWIPGHIGIEGNELADRLAKQAVTSEKQYSFGRLVSISKRTARKKI